MSGSRAGVTGGRSSAGPRLRAWQQEALQRFEMGEKPSFLAVATPGAGKTTFALTAVRRALLARRAQRTVVVVPTQHLKQQWAHAAESFGIHLDPDWAPGYGALPSDVHGIAVTYQQVASNPHALRTLVRGAFAVLDEIHHAGESRTWGDAVRTAFEHATARLCLSGTPFRSDQNSIPFVTYDGDLAQPDYEYGYGEALKEGRVVRPVYFPRINGHMEWTAPGGLDYAATFDDPLTRELSNQRLRTALNVEGEWLPTVLEQAHAQLVHLRQRDPRAAGLVIAMDQEHARGIAQIMSDRLRISPVIATSDEPTASDKISEFVSGVAPWIVAVRMVSEGVDIPRLRIGVYATNTITDLFFRQAVGRLVRWIEGGGRQNAYMFIPDDVRLRTFGATIAEQRRHSLRKPGDEKQDDPFAAERAPGEQAPAAEEEADGQLSLFTAISAVALDDQGRRLEEPRVFDPELGDPIPDLAPPRGPGAPDFALPPVRLEPAPPVPLPARESGSLPPPPAEALSPLARRRQLREQNSDAVTDLAHLTGRPHAELNAELNRRLKIRRISEATVRQLQQRLELARKMMRG